MTMPGTRYSITYRKGAEPWLLASDGYDDSDFPSRKHTFRARAWTAANDKARELGGLCDFCRAQSPFLASASTFWAICAPLVTAPP